MLSLAAARRDSVDTSAREAELSCVRQSLSLADLRSMALANLCFEGRLQEGRRLEWVC